MARQQDKEPEGDITRTNPLPFDPRKGVDKDYHRDYAPHPGMSEASKAGAGIGGLGHATDARTPGINPLDKEALAKPAASQGENFPDHPAMRRGQAQRSDPNNLGAKVLDDAELKHNSKMP